MCFVFESFSLLPFVLFLNVILPTFVLFSYAGLLSFFVFFNPNFKDVHVDDE